MLTILLTLALLPLVERLHGWLASLARASEYRRENEWAAREALLREMLS